MLKRHSNCFRVSGLCAKSCSGLRLRERFEVFFPHLFPRNPDSPGPGRERRGGKLVTWRRSRPGHPRSQVTKRREKGNKAAGKGNGANRHPKLPKQCISVLVRIMGHQTNANLHGTPIFGRNLPTNGPRRILICSTLSILVVLQW